MSDLDYPEIPMGAQLTCRNCGNRSDSHYWHMRGGACPNCGNAWRKQLNEYELGMWQASSADTVEVAPMSGNFLPSIFGPARDVYRPDTRGMSYGA